MNLQISCVVNGQTEYIELGGTDAVTLDISFAEIQDITKKNSAYSKEFNVPGTNGNNYIFEYFFDLNQVPLDFIPTEKFEAQMLYNGYIVASGYIRLNTVTIVKEQKTYNITFYNGVGDVAASISDKFMRQLDLSYLSHPFTNDVPFQSTVDYNLFPLTGTTNYSYQNGKTYWPILNIGYNYVENVSGLSQYYTSNIAGVNITIEGGNKNINIGAGKPWVPGDIIRFSNSASNWIQGVVVSYNVDTGAMEFDPDLALGSGTFATWTLTYHIPNGSQITDPITSPLILFGPRPNVPNYMSFSGTPIRSYYTKPSIQIKELYEQVFIQNGYSVESNFFNTSYFERFYLPLKFLDETVYSKGAVPACYSFCNTGLTIFNTFTELLNPSSAVTCNNLSFSANTTGFTIPSLYSGFYMFRLTMDFEYQAPECSVNEVEFLAYYIVNGIQYPIVSFYAPCVTTGIGLLINEILTQDTLINIPSGGGTVQIAIQVDKGILIFNSICFEIVDSPRFIIGNFDYSAEFPENDFKQIDFITSINRYFNLVCVPHITKPKTIVVEPMIDYIGKGKELDWTSKIDFDSPITISPVTNIVSGTLNYNFALDQDYINQQFNISNNRVFGTYQLQLSQEYKDNNIDFNTIFSSPTDVDINNSNLPALSAPSMAAIKTDEKNGLSIQRFNPYKILPRLLFRGVVMPSQNYANTSTGATSNYFIETDSFDRWAVNNRYTTYPFSYTGFSHYINFNSENTYNSIQQIFPTQPDIYDIYYSDYIEDLMDTSNKIMKAKIYLTPCEIADLEFNEKIIIKNSYWRINKISGYNLVEPSLCDIELIKLTRDYTPHPVLYYDLINCSTGGTDYHTNSDLNYNLYAYIGKYVNIFTGSTTAYTSIGCFEVQLGQYNGSYTYEHVFIGSGYTSSGVSVYSDCGCSGTTSFSIVQQT